MPSEPTVLASDLLNAEGEHDYEALHAALSSNARGRAFLAEYARRNRNADTGAVLDALSRLESLVQKRAAPPADTVRSELRALLDIICTARVPVAASAMPEKAARLAALIAELERRITGLIAAAPEETGLMHGPVQPIRQPAARAPAEIKPIPLHLAVVPPPEEPELPIPSPSAQPPVIRLVDTLARIPQISWGEPEAGPARVAAPDAIDASPQDVRALATPEPVETETPVAEPPALPTVAMALAEPEPAAPRPDDAAPPADPLAPIMLLSEEERIALFT